MKIKKQVILRSVAGEHMLVPVGDTVFQYNGIFTLTESAKLLWENLENCSDEAELTDVILRQYDIDRATAEKDVRIFLNKLREFGII